MVERAGQILPNQLDLAGSRVIHEDLARAGVHIILNSSVSEMRGEDSVRHVALTDHSIIPADLVVLATGIRPNKELAEAAGLAINRGITVNEHMQTSNADIYAAGDVIEIEDVATGRRVCSATWFNAILQGRFAAYNMVGHAIARTRMPSASRTPSSSITCQPSPLGRRWWVWRTPRAMR